MAFSAFQDSIMVSIKKSSGYVVINGAKLGWFVFPFLFIKHPLLPDQTSFKIE